MSFISIFLPGRLANVTCCGSNSGKALSWKWALRWLRLDTTSWKNNWHMHAKKSSFKTNVRVVAESIRLLLILVLDKTLSKTNCLGSQRRVKSDRIAIIVRKDVMGYVRACEGLFTDNIFFSYHRWPSNFLRYKIYPWKRESNAVSISAPAEWTWQRCCHVATAKKLSGFMNS